MMSGCGAAGGAVSKTVAADPCVNLVGFSDGSLSGDSNSGGHSWMVAVVENEVIQEGGVLACGGGAALAALTTQTCC
jgi:hypothetical protein